MIALPRSLEVFLLFLLFSKDLFGKYALLHLPLKFINSLLNSWIKLFKPIFKGNLLKQVLSFPTYRSKSTTQSLQDIFFAEFLNLLNSTTLSYFSSNTGIPVPLSTLLICC